MRLRLLLLCLLTVLPAQASRAQALARSAPAGSCLQARVDALQMGAGDQVLYRIVFLNRCTAVRSFFWCAEHPAAPLPATVVCPSSQGGRGLGAEPRHMISHRKEFQWHLPPGARIRFQDCPAQEIPTAEFGCAPPLPNARR